MKSLIVAVCLLAFGCAKSGGGLGSATSPVDSLGATKNLFEKYNGCYQIVGSTATDYKVTFETIKPTCPNSIGSSQLISRSITNGDQWASLSYPITIWPSGSFVETNNSISYSYQGQSFKDCQLEPNMIAVETYTITQKGDLFHLAATGIYCSNNLTYEACKNLGPAPMEVDFKKIACPTN